MINPARATKRELVAWLEARGLFSLLRGWADYSRHELDMLVSEQMRLDREVARDNN